MPPYLAIDGRMTGVRNSKTFYDMGIYVVLKLNDSLLGPHLLGNDTARVPTRRTELLQARSFLTLDEEYSSRARRPVRLLVRKFDKQQRIVSGTFEGMLYSNRGTDSLAVTDGRFDVKY